jgi:hypothetical protein
MCYLSKLTKNSACEKNWTVGFLFRSAIYKQEINASNDSLHSFHNVQERNACKADHICSHIWPSFYLCVYVSQPFSQSFSQSVFLFIRTCQLEELWTTFCDILYVPHVSGEEFSSVVFNFLQ